MSSICEAEAETLEPLLLICPVYANTRAGLVQKWKSVQNPAVSVLAKTTLTRPPPYLMQFLLDATVLSLTRTWCYSIHIHFLPYLHHFKSLFDQAKCKFPHGEKFPTRRSMHEGSAKRGEISHQSLMNCLPSCKSSVWW